MVFPVFVPLGKHTRISQPLPSKTTRAIATGLLEVILGEGYLIAIILLLLLLLMVHFFPGRREGSDPSFLCDRVASRPSM